MQLWPTYYRMDNSIFLVKAKKDDKIVHRLRNLSDKDGINI